MTEKYKFHDKKALYCVAPTIVGTIDLFTRKEYCDIILDTLHHYQKEKGLVIHSWSIMSSHLHLIISTKDEDLAIIMQDFKTQTTKKIIEKLEQGKDKRKEWILETFAKTAKKIKPNKNYEIWEDGNPPILLETNQMLDQQLHYIHHNPVQQKIVSNQIKYTYSSAKDYAGEKGLLEIEKVQ